MFDSVSPAESESIGVVSSGWLWAARCSALICTIALGGGFVAEAAADDIMAALFFFGPGVLLSLALLFFCSVGGRIHWHLRLVWARRRLSLPCSGSPSLSCLGRGSPLRFSATFIHGRTV